MKKILALVLALTMVLALSACGSGSAPGGSTPAESGAASSGANTSAQFGDVANDPAVTLTASSSFPSTALPGVFWEFFKEDVEKLSGGSISIDLYTGGTLFGADEEMKALSEGTIDMMMTFTPANAFNLPCIASIYYTPGSIEDTQKVMNYILFEDADSSAAVAEAFAANNATVLPFFVVTSDIVFATKGDASSWSDMYTGKFACPMDANYTDMGYQNLVTVIDSEQYESLRTGLVDSVQTTKADIVSSKLYEVCDTYVVCPANRVDHWMTINTDKLNSLTDNQRAVLEQACADLLAYSAETENRLSEEFADVVEENGGKVIEMTPDEVEWFLYCGDILGWQSGLDTLAQMTDSVDAMTAVQNANREGMNQYTAYDFDALSQKYAN